jgi:V8-like Glu-specific endopeptidase
MHGSHRTDHRRLTILIPFMLFLSTISYPPLFILASQQRQSTNSVGQILRPDNTHGCTVFKVGLDTLATAGHCVRSASKIVIGTRTIGFPNYWQGESMGIGRDWAYLYVPQAVDADMLHVAGAVLDLPEVMYVDGYPNGVRTQATCARWPWHTGPGLALRCDTPMSGGVSGAPVYRDSIAYGVVTHVSYMANTLIMATDLRGKSIEWPDSVKH